MISKKRYWGKIPFSPEWFDFDREVKMEKKVRNQELLRFEQNTEPSNDCGCPKCGAAAASHEGNIYHLGYYVGDAWECGECLERYWCPVPENK